ncbi:predicted protein [Histoplasma mississippiense (nom. inval.)]|uniref:predicted protein n=1 Tax=Ajellomyces capsulatus (strain NAm1 / WU24) TaxID=2059318 RepID=UPI000157CF73|nr:predicted protein [Histoplasma mississippiense (nom. inval.)]EDN10775.1 predicted protein [Histoplasma mississippiense (nom. inval.)]
MDDNGAQFWKGEFQLAVKCRDSVFWHQLIPSFPKIRYDRECFGSGNAPTHIDGVVFQNLSWCWLFQLSFFKNFENTDIFNLKKARNAGDRESVINLIPEALGRGMYEWYRGEQ